MSFWDKFLSRPPKSAAAPAAAAVIKPYAMERTGEDSGEIVLYGDIVSERPTHWWTDEPLDGQYIVLSEFLDDLKQMEDVANLTVRIHSAGGSAYDAMTIHNRLKALKAHVTVIVDGVAMSGGAMIMCAGDTVQVFPGSLIMIHKCWAYAVGNADELRRVADCYDAADRSQAAIFQAKTGLGTEELLAMMAAETYMTGQEAIDKGFADELAEGSALDVAASADRRTLYVGGRPVWTTARTDGIPAVIPTVKPEASAPVVTNTHQPAQTGGQNGGNTMAKTLEELRTENPQLAQQLMAEARAAVSASGAAAPTATPPAPAPASAAPAAPAAPQATPATDPAPADPVAAERQRIQDIDALAGLFDTETINAAKYGDNACTAQEMAYRAAQKASAQGSKFLAALAADAQGSGTQQVGAASTPGGAPAGEDDLTPAQLMAKGRSDAQAMLNPKKEEK